MMRSITFLLVAVVLGGCGEALKEVPVIESYSALVQRVDSLESMVKGDSSDTTLLGQLGRSYIELHRRRGSWFATWEKPFKEIRRDREIIDRAISCFKKSIGKRTPSAKEFVDMGDAYLARNNLRWAYPSHDLTRAFDMFYKAIQLDSLNVEAIDALADAYRMYGVGSDSSSYYYNKLFPPPSPWTIVVDSDDLFKREEINKEMIASFHVDTAAGRTASWQYSWLVRSLEEFDSDDDFPQRLLRFDQRIKAIPRAIRAPLMVGLSVVLKRDYTTEIIDISESVLSHLPVSEMILSRLWQAYARRDNMKMSLRRLGNTLDAFPFYDARSFLWRYNKEDRVRYEQLARLAVQERPNDPRIYTGFSGFFEDGSRKAEFVRRALELDSLFAPAYQDLAAMALDEDSLEYVAKLLTEVYQKDLDGEWVSYYARKLSEGFLRRRDFGQYQFFWLGVLKSTKKGDIDLSPFEGMRVWTTVERGEDSVKFMNLLTSMLGRDRCLDATIYSQIADWCNIVDNDEKVIQYRMKAARVLPCRRTYFELYESQLLAGALDEALQTAWTYHRTNPQEPALIDLGKPIFEMYYRDGKLKALKDLVQSIASKGEIIASLTLKNLQRFEELKRSK